MSPLPRPIATALLAASLVIVPVGLAAGEPTDSPTATTSTPTESTSTETTSPAEASSSTTTAPLPTEVTASPPAEESETRTTAEPPTTQAVPQHQAGAAASLADPPGAAANWLVGQLTEGDHFATEFGGQIYADQGLTADGALALAASGGHDETLGKMVRYLFETSGGYTGQDFGEVYAGSLAKLALVSTVTGQDPSGFLEDLMDQMRVEGEDDHGRFSDSAFDYDDDGSPDDYSNSITQALAIIGLDRAGEDVPAAAVDFLVGERCADGGFPSLFPADGEPCVSDPDATGFVVQALAVVSAGSAELSSAVTWLVDNQDADGSFAAEGPVNATAVAGQGLLAGGEDAASARATAWLAEVQDEKGWLPIAPGGEFGDARATAQAVMLLAGETLGSVSGPVRLPPPAPTTTTPSPTTSASPAASDSRTQAAGLTAGLTGGGTADGGTNSGGAALARTGSDIEFLLPAGAALLLAGGLFVLVSRRRPVGAHRG